ncbi:MAG: ABC transporter substrate-binding protein [Rhizobiales bacterium]|nr:ABC transporter substrate-binding protein [Hoeflea sp.]MBG21118.1 ABC transporter substrate-binding protein [Hyphomicrobiales bacterium]
MIKPTLSRRQFLASTAAAGAATLASPAYAQSRELVIISNRGSAGQRAALEAIAAEFGKDAGVKVSVNNMDHEAHKTAIRNYLVASPPDFCFWFSGERMKSFVARDLFADITDLVEEQNYADVVPALGATTVDGRVYGMPTAGIMWGMWYLQDVFDEQGWTAPTTRDEFLAFGEKARAAGMDPIAIGTKEMWPAAGWFDHMNLRINGLKHHMDLMAGKIAYTDQSLVKVMDAWAEQINAKLFNPNMTSFVWDQAAASLAQKRAAMMDLGGFISYGIPEEQHKQLRFSPFPIYDSSLGRFEDYSVDSVHIPKKAPNPEVAREWLVYFYEAERQKRYLEPEGNVPARIDVDMSSNHIVSEAQKGLAGMDGSAQYFDRDTNPDVAQAGLKGFQEFMVRPERAQSILQSIEGARSRAYGKI